MKITRKLVKDILTGIDNTSFDNGRVLCFISFLVYYGMAIASFCTGHPWSALDFSGGIGGMAVGFGINLKLKHATEPKDLQESESNQGLAK